MVQTIACVSKVNNPTMGKCPSVHTLPTVYEDLKAVSVFQPAGLCLGMRQVVLRINLLSVLSVLVPVLEVPRGELWCVRMKTDTLPLTV